MMELDSEKKSIDEFAEVGNVLFDEGKYNQAIEAWMQNQICQAKDMRIHL